VLTRLALEWSTSLGGTRLVVFRQESGERFRLTFASESRDGSLIVSLDPTEPWIGEAVRHWDGPRWSPDSFVPAVSRALTGRLVAGIIKAPADRSIRVDFGEGTGLAVELTPHAANLILLGPGGTVAAALRRSKASHERLMPGRAWSDRGIPSGRVDPFGTEAREIDDVVSRARADGEEPDVALRRRFVGLSSIGIELAVAEHAVTGRSLGSVLRDRLDSILDGSSEVLIERLSEPSDTTGQRLLPWRPDPAPTARRLVTLHGPAATAAAYFEAADDDRRVKTRIASLGRILRGELARTRVSEGKVREGLREFDDPDRIRRMGEALLAGLSIAQRLGDTIMVPDPYDPGGREIVITAPPDRTLAQVADDLFRRQRRSRRGLEAAGRRAEALSARASRLEALLDSHGRTIDGPGAEQLEAGMRAAGLPVGLVGPTRSARAAAKVIPPRLDGVRIIESTDGWTILVGRTARDNDRLTFKIAAPDDIWLHAAGVHGAHVVIRNPERSPAPPPETLAEAARLALWFSDGRSEAAGDVQWTRRKNVRRAKGRTSGQVVLKRFETIRVRPRPPKDGTGSKD
jgi:predicted ribosome quality control (RQC) complex YloA/Tae2 family protein